MKGVGMTVMAAFAKGWAWRMWGVGAMAAGLLLAACSHAPGGRSDTPPAPATMEIAVLGFNDLHGHLAPGQLALPTFRGPVPAGGMAYLAGAVQEWRQQHAHSLVIAAGDLVGASPLESALFLDEPTIEAMNLMGLDFSAVGNHELDRGWRELLRLQQGGCERYTVRIPCQIGGAFGGAQFQYLSANIRHADGRPLVPATGLRRYAQAGSTVTVGVIGATLRTAGTMVASDGVRDLRWDDEADAINAQIPALRAQGADVIVLALHEGGQPGAGMKEGDSCEGLRGDIVPILRRLDPGVDWVISGHTHQAYVCDYAKVDPQRRFGVSSAGFYGVLFSDIRLTVDLSTRRVVHRSARNVPVQGEGFVSARGPVVLNPQWPVQVPDGRVLGLVQRYQEASGPLAQRPAGLLGGAVRRQQAPSLESPLGNLVADAQLAAARAAGHGGRLVSFMNPGGLRADLVPDGAGHITYGQLFSVQPFGNHVVVATMTGAQVREVLEQQFASGTNTPQSPRVLSVSEGFRYRYDLRRPAGQRVDSMQWQGVPVLPDDSVEVVMSSYLAGGGDNFTALTQGRNVRVLGQDLDVLEAYVGGGQRLAVPATHRIERVSP